MRLLPLALVLGLVIAAGPVLAAPRPDRASGGVSSERRAAKPAPAVSRGAAGHKAAHRAAQSRRGTPQKAVRHASPVRGPLTVAEDAVTACGPRKGKTSCRAPRASWSWTAGLPPAANIQASECPDGTMATLARGHEDIVRCMPL